MIEILKREIILEDITSNLEVGICQFDVENDKFLYVSPAIEKIFGISAIELLKDHTLFCSTFHQDDKPMVTSFFGELTEGLKEIEYRVINQYWRASLDSF